MNTFPTTVKKPDFPIDVEEIYPVGMDNFEANYVQLIKKANRSRRRWTYNWQDEYILSSTDFETIRTFWLANRSSWFYLTHPYTGETYEAAFENMTYKQELIAIDITDEYDTMVPFYSLTITFLEK